MIIRVIVIVRNELSVIVKACLESRDGFIKECCMFLYGKTGAECGMILYIGEEAGMLSAEGNQPVRDSPEADKGMPASGIDRLYDRADRGYPWI